MTTFSLRHMVPKASPYLLVLALAFSVGETARAASAEEAAQGMVQRLIPEEADSFCFETIAAEDGHDVFEVESRGDKIVVRGSNGVAMASGWNWYVEQRCHGQVSLWASQLRLPKPLPVLEKKVRVVTPFSHRYFLNFCTFSYSLAWWDWPQWERLIDWMALNGINMPLAITGEEAIWQKVYHDLGLTDRQLEPFFVGPAFLPFGWMGCIDGWCGPLPQSWIDRHLELQKKIVARQRELGMRPVLQGFTGHVPAAFQERFPQAKLVKLTPWCGFPSTYFLSPEDPLFQEVGRRFIEEQTRQFGTAHLYASDTFIEMPPPSNDPAFLAAMGRSVYGAMQAGDPEAVWVMQGWIFCNAPDFWKPPQAKALLGAVPGDRMLLLDLACETMPQWAKTEAFYGKPWIWSLVQTYGDHVDQHGGLATIASGFQEAITSPNHGKLVGLGFAPEGLGYTPVVNTLLADLTWRPEAPELSQWLSAYAERRYGVHLPAADEAWRALLDTAYQTPGHTETVVTDRPALQERATGFAAAAQPPYEIAKLKKAWQRLLDCREPLGDVATYQFDLVQVTRQVLGNLAFELRKEALAAYEKKDRQALKAAAERFLTLIDDMDRLTATREELLLGRWLADAVRWATNDEERALYEHNARTLITTWGPADGVLHDYACKSWSGMLSDFYRPRWQMFFQRLDTALAENRPLDEAAYVREICAWETAWTHRQDRHPTTPQGNAVTISRALWETYGQ